MCIISQIYIKQLLSEVEQDEAEVCFIKQIQTEALIITPNLGT